MTSHCCLHTLPTYFGHSQFNFSRDILPRSTLCFLILHCMSVEVYCRRSVFVTQTIPRPFCPNSSQTFISSFKSPVHTSKPQTPSPGRSACQLLLQTCLQMLAQTRKISKSGALDLPVTLYRQPQLLCKVLKYLHFNTTELGLISDVVPCLRWRDFAFQAQVG